MKVIKISQQGYCNGVKRALDIVKNTIKDNVGNKQIYILGNIINNRYVTNEFSKYGVITLDSNDKTRFELIQNISDGIVILTAHGVSPQIYKYLQEHNIEYIDATCPFVKIVQARVSNLIKDNYDVIYIGKNNHPESEGIININRSHIHLVTNIEDINLLKISNHQIIIDTQTTLSEFYTKPLINAIKLKFPYAKFASGVCRATTLRQQALINELDGELCLIVGDSISSNANELLKIASKKMPSYLINHVSQIKKEWLDNVKTITLTSAASTPSELTEEIYNYLINYT